MLLKRKSNYYDIDAVTYLYFSHMIRVLPILKTFIILIVYIYIYNTVNKDYLCEIYLNYTLCINNQSGKVLFPYHNDYEFFSCQISVLLWKGFQLLFQWFLKSLPSYNLYIYIFYSFFTAMGEDSFASISFNEWNDILDQKICTVHEHSLIFSTRSTDKITSSLPWWPNR